MHQRAVSGAQSLQSVAEARGERWGSGARSGPERQHGCPAALALPRAAYEARRWLCIGAHHAWQQWENAVGSLSPLFFLLLFPSPFSSLILPLLFPVSCPHARLPSLLRYPPSVLASAFLARIWALTRGAHRPHRPHRAARWRARCSGPSGTPVASRSSSSGDHAAIAAGAVLAGASEARRSQRLLPGTQPPGAHRGALPPVRALLVLARSVREGGGRNSTPRTGARCAGASLVSVNKPRSRRRRWRRRWRRCVLGRLGCANLLPRSGRDARVLCAGARALPRRGRR